MKKLILITSLNIFLAALAFSQSADDIVRRADALMDYDTAYTESRMVNTDRFGTKTIKYMAWSKGNNFLMEFTSDGEYGQKILRTEDRIYHFFPDSEAVFTKSKGDSIVGLISYDDVTDESSLLDNYTARLEGEEEINGISCYKISLQVKEKKRVSYPIQLVWIAKDTYTMWRIEMFTRSNQPLKTMTIREVKEFDGRQMAVDILLTDEVRRGVSSEIFIDSAQLGVDISDNKFTRRELTR